MAGRRTPPPYQLKKADAYSRGIAKGLVLAYPMLEGGGTTVHNYGAWGANADLTLSNATWTRREGVQGLDFPSASAVARNTTISQTIPQTWSYAFWAKLDTAPSTAMDLFSLRGSAQVNLRAWADNSGVWAWQKRGTADAYSIQPTSDHPTDQVRLIVATYTGIDNQPPMQQRTGNLVKGLPVQPAAYSSFNVGAGVQLRDINGIFLGNNPGLTAAWDGVVGPVYFWSRVISDGEIWQLWQDPYAPLRRHGSQIMNPAMMITQADTVVTDNVGGKPDYSRQVFTDNTALFIQITDTYFYQQSPTDNVDTGNSGVMSPTTINLTETYTYQNDPTDTLATLPPNGLQTPLTLNLAETYVYQNDPPDSTTSGITETIPPTVINLTETYTYRNDPTDTVDVSPPGGGANNPLLISQTEIYTYLDDPTDQASSP
jgi:hypothetical protein